MFIATRLPLAPHVAEMANDPGVKAFLGPAMETCNIWEADVLLSDRARHARLVASLDAGGDA